jgi:hypothetical protein
MALAPIDAVCDKCGHGFTARPRRTFLGFQRVQCPNCKASLTYSLTGGYRITYWVIAVLMILSFVGGLQNGTVMVPGILGIGTIVALIQDRRIRAMRQAGPDHSNSRPSSQPASGELRRERTCPWCAERILAEARVCKHCHRDVEPVARTGG